MRSALTAAHRAKPICRSVFGIFALLAVLCSCSRTHGIVVGSKNFTEQWVLGEIAAQQIERKLHVEVRRKLNLGGTLLTHEAIENGAIDIYPEYTGTAAGVVLKQRVPNDPAQVYIAVRDAYLRRFHLVWLPPLGFNDSFAMVVRSEDARRLPTPTLSAAAARNWRLGVGYEFLTRPDGLERLDGVYHLSWKGNPRSMDLGLLYRALQEEHVDMAAGNSTDAQLTLSRYAVLQDDRKAFPPYDACFVVRQELMEGNPEVARVLNELENRISEATMRDLNRRVQVEHVPVETVARDFLARLP
ncbi:MAG: ABC transporter substrate-binding protein [Acidobacteriaceae bacterium]|nr:ABC transporter substrate-binding protein [Acidobacteriaceae bacterium]